MSRSGKPSPKKGKQYAPQSLRYFPRCLWCGAQFGASRPDAKTCSRNHRSMLGRYVSKHGSPPMFPFGAPSAPTLSSGPSLIDDAN